MITKNYWTLSYEDAYLLCSLIDCELVSPPDVCKVAAAAITANIKQAMNVGINAFQYGKEVVVTQLATVMFFMTMLHIY